MELARSIDEARDYDRLSSLADALESAGCGNQRILKHCRRKGGHVRGCWVLDMVMGSEPEPKEKEFAWDFTWEHATIDAGKLKERIQAFGGSAPGDAKRVDDSAALAFATWLERNGDAAWANYVRIRCALDGKAPAANYPDLMEQYFERGAAMRPARAEFEGFYFSGYRFADEKWWEDDADDMERGLPSLVQAVTPGRGPGPVAQLVQRIDALVSNTPVRGIDFEWHYASDMARILDSPSAQRLRWLAFANRHPENEPGDVIGALGESPLAPTLERLQIKEGITSDGDALTLAEAPFERLRRLDLPALCSMRCSAKAASRLLTATWFRKLQQVLTGFSEDCCEVGMLHLAGMPALHSLALFEPPERQILALSRSDEFSSLRRLFVNRADLTGKSGEAFQRMKAPQLIELWLRASKADVRTLVEAPFFAGLRVLSFSGPRLDEAGLELVAGSASAPQLRMLRLDCGGNDLTGSFRSLAGTPLTRPGAFPELTTLRIEYPFTKKAKRDTARFLHKLATPCLRHLTLKNCGFDDECAKALASNPSFANLTRLCVDQGLLAAEKVSPKAAEAMFHASNLQNLVELKLDNFPLGKALEGLADDAVMPKLVSGSFSDSEAPPETIERLKAKRPMMDAG